MSDFSIMGNGGTATEGFGANLATTSGTIVAPNATAHTKGAYVELIASTGIDYNELILQLQVDDVDLNCLVDIAIGAAASEQIIISDVSITGIDASTGRSVDTLPLPIHIPKGTRISARCQSAATSGIGVFISGMGIASGMGGSSPLNRVTTEGADTAATKGVEIDPGAVAHTKGVWVEITASTLRDYAGFLMATDQNNNTGVGAIGWLYDVAIGGAGSEEIIVHDLMRGSMTFGHNTGQTSPYISVAIPKGTRVSVRGQASTTNLNDRKFAATIIGVS